MMRPILLVTLVSICGCASVPVRYAVSAPTLAPDGTIWLTAVRAQANATDHMFVVRCPSGASGFSATACEWYPMREGPEPVRGSTATAHAAPAVAHGASAGILACVSAAHRPLVIRASVGADGALVNPELASDVDSAEGTCLADELTRYRADARVPRDTRIELRFPSAQTD